MAVIELTADPEHPGFYLADGLTVDPDHPGFYLAGGLTVDPEHPGFYLTPDTPPGVLIPETVIGSTVIEAVVLTRLGYRELTPELIVGQTAVTAALTVVPPLGPMSPDTVVGSTAATVTVSIGHTLEFDPELVVGKTAVTAVLALSYIFELTPELVAGATVVTADLMPGVPVDPITLDVVIGSTSAAVLERPAVEFTPALVVGRTDVNIAGTIVLKLDTAQGRTSAGVAIVVTGVCLLGLDPVQGTTVVRILHIPNLSRNTPILLAFSARMRLESVEPLVST